MHKKIPSGTTALAVVALLALMAGSAVAQSSSTATGVSRLMNPALSLNALMLGQTSADVDGAVANGADLQEAEVQFTAIVDPFWQADVIVTFEPGEGDAFEAGIEQAVIESLSMPSGLALRLGKFFLPFGKHAQLHTHMYPFVHAPLAQTATLGDAPADVGAELGWTVPLPWWSDLLVYAVDGRTEFHDAESSDPACGARWSNLWDASEQATLELGFSGLTGPAADPAVQGARRVFGADLTYKWVSGVRSQGPALTAQAELFLPDADGLEGDPLGLNGLLQYRFQRQWWLGLGADLARDVRIDPLCAEPSADAALGEWREYKANLTFVPSEFSALRFELSYREETETGVEDLRFAVQANFTIGSHPAHTY